MKKIFSTVAMAVVAFASVVSMASCSNDSPSSLNAAPQVPAKNTQQTASTNTNNTSNANVNYIYEATLTNDVFKIFDVTIVRTIGTETKTYTFENAADMKDAMSTGKDYFTAPKSTHVSVKTTLKLKANYQEVLDKVAATGTEENPAELVMKAYPGHVFPNINNSGDISLSKRVFGGRFIAKTLDKESLAIIKDTMEGILSPNNGK